MISHLALAALWGTLPGFSLAGSAPSSLADSLAGSLAGPLAQDQHEAQVTAPAESPAEADPATESLGEAAKAALKEAPDKSKVGNIRGVRATSEVRFASSPDDPYEMVASFGIPARARVALANKSGSFKRFQLGARLFGLDSQAGQASKSYVLSGQGLRETQIDIELRRALFLWPDAPRFTGAGRTFTSKIGDFGVLMATVDESTGLPTKIESFGKDGGAGAEFNGIQWAPAQEDGGRARPISFTFAAGGQAIWTETVETVQYNWRFADTWFVPADSLTAVMGSQVPSQMHVRALEGAWFHRVKIADLPRGGDSESLDKTAAIAAASAEWANVRRRPELSAEGKSAYSLSPYVSLVLGPFGEPFAIEYESMGTAPGNTAGPDGWKWRKPSNIWAYPLVAARMGSKIEGFGKATQALASIYPDESGFQPLQRIRFRVGEERLNGKATAIGVDPVLNVVVPLEELSDPKASSDGN